MADDLTPMEREVARRIAEGMSDAEILAASAITRWQLQRAIRALYRASESSCARGLVVWCQRAVAV